MKIILKIIFWSVQFISIIFVPCIISFLMYIKIGKTMALKIFSVLTVMSFAAVVYFSNNPYIEIRDEYKEYITEEKLENIKKYNSGIYSDTVPFIPIYIGVKYADEDIIKIRTQYYPFGFTEMNISDGIPSLERNIFGT